MHVSEQQHVRASVGFISTYRSYSAGSWGVGEWVGEGTFRGAGQDCKGISSMKSFMPRAHRVVAEGPGNFPHSPGLKQEHFLEHGPFPERSKTW